MSQETSLADLMAQDAKDTAKQSIELPSSSTMTDLTALVRAHTTLSNEILELQEVLSEKNKKLLALSQTEIPEIFEQMGGIAKLTLDDGRTVSVASDVSVSIKKGEDEACFSFLESHKLGAIIKSNFNLTFGKDEQEKIDAARDLLLENNAEFSEKRAVHASTLKSNIKKLTEKGVSVPSSFNYFPYKKTVIK